MFDQGDVRFVILKLISEKPSHGYEIIKAIEDRLGGAYAPSPGIVYPALTLLEEQGAHPRRDRPTDRASSMRSRPRARACWNATAG